MTEATVVLIYTSAALLLAGWSLMGCGVMLQRWQTHTGGRHRPAPGRWESTVNRPERWRHRRPPMWRRRRG